MSEPQTANQINSAQVGHVEIKPQTVPATKPPVNPPVAQKTRSAQPVKPTPIVRTPQPGWWSFSQSGLRDAVVKAVNDSTVPDGYKAAIVGSIQSKPAGMNSVFVDAHCHLQDGKEVVHITISAKSFLV